MITLRPKKERGRTNLGWLDSWHSFSFGGYQDPQHVEFRDLRVINDDTVGPGGGFPPHPHRDMEIVTYVMDGQLEHRDSLGNGSIVGAGEIQKMSAGRGIRHSEFNPSDKNALHFYQIWIYPNQSGLDPSYEQKTTPSVAGLHLIASPEGGEAVKMHQDVRLYLGRFESGQELAHQLEEDRHAWVQVTRGELSLNGLTLSAGDGAAVSQEELLSFRSQGPSEVLLFDLA
jgi:redox-sensitive bicupin YhaK (pirin superfamily)